MASSTSKYRPTAPSTPTGESRCGASRRCSTSRPATRARRGAESQGVQAKSAIYNHYGINFKLRDATSFDQAVVGNNYPNTAEYFAETSDRCSLRRDVLSDATLPA